MMNKKKEVTENQWDMLDYFNDPAYVTSYDDVFLYVNDAACKHWGKSREEIIGRPIFVVFPEGKGTIMEEKRLECLELKKQLITEIYFPHPPYEGWYELIHSPCPEGIITRFRIISEKAKASASIDFLYEFIMMFLNQLQVPVVITDLRFKIKEGNSTLTKFFGLSTKSSLIGYNFFDKLCQGKQELILPVFKEVFSTCRSKVVQVDSLELTISTIFDYFDLPLYYIIFFREVNKSVQFQRESHELNPTTTSSGESRSSNKRDPKLELYQALWDQSGIPTAYFSQNGDIVSVNESMNELFSGQINFNYNLLNDPHISLSTKKKIRNCQIVHTEKHFSTEHANHFFFHKSCGLKEDCFFDVIVKPLFQKKNQELLGYTVILIDRLEYKRKKDDHCLLYGNVIDALKNCTNELKESLNSLLLLVKDTEGKKFLSEKLKIQKKLLCSLKKEVENLQKMEPQ